MEAKRGIHAHDVLSHLSRADPVLARIIASVGPFKLKRRLQSFQALVRAIIFQQLAGRAARAIYKRFASLFGGSRFPTAARSIRMPFYGGSLMLPSFPRVPAGLLLTAPTKCTSAPPAAGKLRSRPASAA